MVVETLLPVAAVGGTAGLAYAAKRKVFPPMPEPDGEHFVLPISLTNADAEDIDSRFIKGVRIPRRSLLALGASGAGKSETLKHFVDQLQNKAGEPVVVYDHKTDYKTFLAGNGAPMIRLSSGVRPAKMGPHLRGISSRRSRPKRTPTMTPSWTRPTRSSLHSPTTNRTHFSDGAAISCLGKYCPK